MIGARGIEKEWDVSVENRNSDAAQDGGGIIKKALGRTTLTFRMIQPGWTGAWNRFTQNFSTSPISKESQFVY